MHLYQYQQTLLHVHIIHRLWLMRMKTDRRLKAAQTRYKQEFDQSVSRLPAFHPGNYVHVDQVLALGTPAIQIEEEM